MADKVNPRAQKAVIAMSEYVNIMSCDEKAFADLMRSEHRTIQQNFTRVCIEWLRTLKIAHDNERYDLRNEASCQLANEIFEKVDEDSFILPFV